MSIDGIAPMTYAAFTAVPNGTRVKNYGFDQCVAVANLYHQGVLGLPLPQGFGAAHQWWTEFDRQPNLSRNYVRSSDPVAGSLFVARGGIYDSSYGHIGVVTAIRSSGSFATIEQNAGTWRHLGRYERMRTAGVYGFLVPNHNPAITTPSGQKEEEEEGMARYIGCYIGNPSGVAVESRSCVIYEPTSGFYTTWSGTPASYINEMARVYATGNFNWITPKHWNETILPQLLIQQRKGA